MGVDICRSVAILLAMWSHVLVTFGAQWDGPSYAWLRFVMQMAPVTFICLFGAMLEIAYVRKVRAGQVEAALGRMFERAAQCYILYVVSVLALLVAGQYSIGYSLRTILLIGITPFTDILKFYALALLVAPLLVVVRLRFGLWPMLVAFLAIQFCYPLLDLADYDAPASGKDYLGPIVGFLYGAGEAGVGAPSFLHGMALVCIGMVIGHAAGALMADDPRLRVEGFAWIILLAAAALVASMLFWTTTLDVLRGIVSLRIRNDNHPFYYALGLFATLLFLLVCILLFDFARLRFADGITFMGAASLFTFCFGNVLLYLQPFGPPGPDRWGPTILYALLIPFQTWVFVRLATVRNPPPRSAAYMVQAVMGFANRAIRRATGPLAAAVAPAVTRMIAPRPRLGATG